MNSKKLIAFTLIELLVVIAIVGILSGFVLVSLNSATNQANDARKKSDLSQIVKALLVYNTENPAYPIETCSIGLTCSATVNNALGQASGITGPNNTYYTYSSIDGTSFTVSAVLSDTDIYSYNPETGYSESSAEPGLPGYAKRQPITINSASALTDYQVKLTIAYDSDMQPDFDDLRFTSADGTTELSYWLESKTDSTTATVWVKVPSLSSGDNTIYMYYANPSATTASNGDNTFVFFDGFDDSLINESKWSTHTGNITLSDGIVTITNSAIDTIQGLKSFNQYQYGIILRTFSKMILSNTAYPEISFTGTGGVAGFYKNYADGKWHLYNNVSGNVSEVADGTADNNYHIFEVARIDSGHVSVKIDGGTWQQNNTYVPTINASLSFRPYCSTGGSNTIYVNWVLIRKYTATEPTSSFGAEQNN